GAPAVPRCLTKPTPTFRPPLRRGTQWRLISHLSLNYLSTCDGGPQALQEILRLYDLNDSAVTRQWIAGLVNISAKPAVHRPSFSQWDSFCRGLEVTLEFDEEKYRGSGTLFLFAAVLERFLGLYTAVNSFVRVTAISQQREEPIRRWPP